MVDDILVLEEFLPYRLNLLADAISREFSKIYRERYGLTRPEWRTLAALGQRGTMTATAIGQDSAMHKTKVSRAVAALEKRKWLARGSDPGDRRVEHLTLTRAGERVYREMVPLAKAFEKKLFAGTQANTMDQVHKAIEALEALVRALGTDLVDSGAFERLTSTKDRCKPQGEDLL